MALIRWDPFAELGPFRRLGPAIRPLHSLIGMRGWQPAVDLCEDDDTFTLKAEIPGVEPEDVDITVTPENITLRVRWTGKKKNKRKDIFVQSDVMVNLPAQWLYRQNQTWYRPSHI